MARAEAGGKDRDRSGKLCLYACAQGSAELLITDPNPTRASMSSLCVLYLCGEEKNQFSTGF